MKIDQSRPSAINNWWISYAPIIATGILFALLKLNGAHIDQALWAEDGPIFINQARDLGISSLLVTYAGYFHLYPRLVALLGSFFDLQRTPFLFLVAWFIAYASLMYVVASRALQIGLSPIEAGFLVILIMAQPHSGEVFFNLTNAQWFMGGALAIYLLVPIKDKSSIYEKGMLFLAFMTGPFALLLTPILLIQIVVYRDWGERKHIYILAGSCALVQATTILLSNRLAASSFDMDISHWVIALYTFVSFGSTSPTATVASLLFWATMIYAIIINSGKKLNHCHDSVGSLVFFLLAGAMIFYAAGLLAAKSNPHLISPLGGGARYFFIPYLLIFFAALLLVSNQPKPRSSIYLGLSTLAISSFNVLERNDLQFKAFTEFARIKNDVYIPIQPQWAAFPSWHIRLSDNSCCPSMGSVDITSVDLKEAKIQNIVRLDDRSINDGFLSLTDDPQLLIRISEKCSQAHYLGIEIHIIRQADGWAQLFWSKDERFAEQQSLRRYYPKGDAIMQFALPRKRVSYLRFDPLEQQGKFYVKSTHIHCLGN